MTMIRVSGSRLHAARVLVGLSREDLAERASCAATQSASGRRRATPSRRQPIRTCAARSMYSRTRAHGSAAMASAYYPATHHYLWKRYPRHQPRTIARVYILVWIWLLGSVTPAYPTRGMSRSPDL